MESLLLQTTNRKRYMTRFSTVDDISLLLYLKKGSLTWRNSTGPPCSVSRQTARAPAGTPAWPPAAFPRARRPLDPHAGNVTDDDRRQPAKQYWPIRRPVSNNIFVSNLDPIVRGTLSCRSHSRTLSWRWVRRLRAWRQPVQVSRDILLSTTFTHNRLRTLTEKPHVDQLLT